MVYERVKRFFSVFLWHRVSIFDQPLSLALDASRHLGSTLLGGRHDCAGTLLGYWDKDVPCGARTITPPPPCIDAATCTRTRVPFLRFVFYSWSRFLLFFSNFHQALALLTWSTVRPPLSFSSFLYQKKHVVSFLSQNWFTVMLNSSERKLRIQNTHESFRLFYFNSICSAWACPLFVIDGSLKCRMHW